MKKVKDLIEKNFIKSKNIWLAYLLAIFLGAFGLHRFYLKKNGLKMLLITVLTLGLGVIITYHDKNSKEYLKWKVSYQK
ncbi:TM2 domain-containing protein [Lactobacillus salivarius]|uniref:TM2 domain-containing protein n=1 Tax=Ligilactobacillus salivarius TaxID=1624 RepID=UPI00136F79A3|nr:TM2 domain-containing protein [Ligilactobacillus salivarius]MYU95466.1 TM2 domain-containing protein [Ligilactobacillus salivarius]MYZ02066.1 TM2 domain-containing protein [Ligilactobacillus salivarius]MYZ22315.1 TM2 domain-containing protein [Ligilactobacillus salivarius]WGT60796.1 TM2 domain-containing protein [Ligilactobacillus salivarius]